MKQGTIFAAFAVLAAVTLLSGTQASAQTIYSNNVGGDLFSVQGPFGSTTRNGQAIGTSGWYYNNVGTAGGGIGGGKAGIDTVQARNGNGSAHLTVVNNGKADIEFYGAATKPVTGSDTSYYGSFGLSGVSLGKLSNLTSLSYDWMRASSSANNVAAPAIRIFLYDNVSAPTKYGYLVFEPYENGYATIPNGVWQSNNLFDTGKVAWGTGTLPGHGQSNLYTVPTWQSSLGTYDVVGISLGIGSSNGDMDAFVDNVKFGFGSTSSTYNFEAAAAPEPCSLIAFGLGGIALIRRRRTK